MSERITSYAAFWSASWSSCRKKIRQYLIANNFVACVIQLPANLFFGTSIATCIMVLKRGKADNKTLFIDASGECVKVTNNNRLTAENIERIVSAFTTREEIKHFSHLAGYSEIAGNDYNLSISTYVEAEDTREKIDIGKLSADRADRRDPPTSCKGISKTIFPCPACPCYRNVPIIAAI